MLLNHYKLREQPFGVTPDPRYFYAGPSHREALASLLYGIEARRGFVALIARPGMGKTTLLFHGLQRLRDKARTVFLFQAIPTPEDLLRALLADLGVEETQGSLVKLQSKLNDLLVEQSRSGKPLVVVLDEAQKLDNSVLELVRMLSNFETSREKLMQIVLSGQPQLAGKLASPDLIQLRQRISIFAHLKPLSLEETALYIDERLRIAGYNAGEPLFTPPAVELIAERSEGIPRNINNICFNALSLGCALRRRTIDGDMVREAVADLDLKTYLDPAPEPALDPALESHPEPLRGKTSPAAWPAEKAAHERPALVTAASGTSVTAPSRTSGIARWLPKFAVASAALLVLAGVLFLSPHFPDVHFWHAHFGGGPVVLEAAVRTNVRTNSVMPPLATADAPSFRLEKRPQPSDNTIRVAPGQTLYGICVESFGNCSAKLLEEFHRLNPRLSNPDHIESGQRIRIPGKPTGATQSSADQPGKA